MIFEARRLEPEMAKPPDLTVSIVSWNTRQLLRDCLRSVYASVEGIKAEVIVVDNGSADGSSEMVRECYRDARLIENADNPGFAAANNQAYAISRGRHFMLLNPDTVVKSALAPLVGYLDGHPGVGVLGCRCLNPDGSVQQNWYDYYPGLLWEMPPDGLRRFAADRLYQRSPDSEFETKWVGGQCMVVRRVAIEEVGAMDPRYFMYSEETDWCLRMRRALWKVVYFPGTTIVHYGGQSTKLKETEMVIELYRSKTQFIRWNYSPFRANLFKVGLLVRTLVTGLLVGRGAMRERRQTTLGLLRSIAAF